MKKTFVVAAIALITVLLSVACTTPNSTTSSNNQATPAAIAARAPRQSYWVTATRVKPEMMPQFREFYLKETLPAQQKAGVKQQSVWVSASLGESFEYVTIRPIEGLQQFDEPSPLAEALGEEGFRKWNAKRATMIVSSRSYVTQSRPEMSIASNPNDALKLIFVTRRGIAPGRGTEYENYFKSEVLPIIKKTNPKGYSVRRVTTGGNTDEYISAVLVDS
ncbi:MAG: hypothetical protein ACRD82_00525, partial [Blastocatellia bacterium]